ncbi:MAG: hypothetical protein ABSF18_07210, partial [Gammaproteobacteria bacterium]
MPQPGNPYNGTIINNEEYNSFFPAANQALKKLILNMYDAHVADLLTNKKYGLLAAEQEEHEQNLIDFFDKNPHIIDEDKALVTQWYNKKFIVKDKEAPKTIADLARTKLTPFSQTNSTILKLVDEAWTEAKRKEESAEIEVNIFNKTAFYKAIEDELIDREKTKLKIDRAAWVQHKKEERDALVKQLDEKIKQTDINTTDLLSSFLVFNYESKKHIKNILDTAVTAHSVKDAHDKVYKLAYNFLGNISFIIADPELETRMSISQSKENIEDYNIYKKYVEASESLKQAQTQNATTYFHELLEQIAIETDEQISELEKAQSWAVNGRIGFMFPFAIFTGTTMAGALVTMAIEWENPIALTIFSIIAVPLFIIVAIANWYIVKNVTEIIREFFTKKKTAWEWFLILFGFSSTVLSVAYTYFATKVFIDSLIALSENSDNQASEGEMIEVFEFDSALDIGIFFISAFSGIATGFAYFAIMHYYNRKISWKLLPETFERIGNLAVIANINWDTYITRQVIVKILLGLIFIMMGITFAPAFLASGIVLASAAVGYIVATALHYYWHKATGRNDQRLFMHVQLALILIMSLASIFFLMWAALPVLTAMAFGCVPVAITLLVLSWLGTACLYTLSTTGTFENILKKNIDIDNLALKASTEMQTICNEEITTPSKHSKSWVESFWEIIKVGNGVGNGLPAMVGGWDFADDEGFGDNMPAKILLSGTMFAYASGISYACNYNGIEKDSNYNGAIFYKQEQLMLINKVRRCYPNLDDAIIAVNKYLTENP